MQNTDQEQDIIDSVQGKIGLSSVEAAALYLSEGKTKDPEYASMIAAEPLDMDAMQRAHLRRMMGFDFKMKVRPRKITISAKEKPELRTSIRLLPGEVDTYGNVVSDKVPDRLALACIRLKLKWDNAEANT